MKAKRKRIIASNLVFIAGLLFMILGITFLLGSFENISKISVFLAFLLLVAGSFCAVWSIRLNKRSSYLFLASFFMLAGIFLFLPALGIISLSLSKLWPLLSVFSGLALLPVGWRRHGGFRLRYLVSSCAFVILGCVLLVFSLKLIPFSFKTFIQTWWPLLFMLGGLTLVLISLSAQKERKD